MAKGTLVALFFMHLIEQRFVNRMVLLISVLFIALLVTLVVADVATRHTFPMGPEM
jgi:cytochrome c oxidase subunit 4